MHDKNVDRLWQLYNLLAQTTAIPASDRKLFLLQESKADMALRNHVLTKLEGGEDLSRYQSEVIGEINLMSGSTTLPGAHTQHPKFFLKDANNLVGKTVLHYEITRIIGYGGMGVVYQGRDVKLDRYVALKFLSPRLIDNDETKERFLNEARAASKLDHQNIGVIHEISDTEDGKSFIVMAFYKGQTLKQKLEDGPLLPKTALDYASQIAAGLEFSHKNGIIHRDIKPSNIIITPDNKVKIVDFGLATFVDRPLPEDSKKIMGTMGYMAPEQRQGLNTDYRTDIWSLGVILHEMLLGKRPETSYRSFSASTHQETLLELPFRSVNGRLLSSLLTKALQSDPGKRYSSVTELLDDLRKASPIRSTKMAFMQSPMSIAILLLVLTAAISLLLSLQPFSAISDTPPSIGIQLLESSSTERDSLQYLTQGATQEIIHHLTQTDGMRVISLIHMGELNEAPLDFAKNLGLSWLTFGTLSKENEQLYITVEVHDTQTNEVVAVIREDRNVEELQGLLYDVSISLVHELGKSLKNRKLADEKRPESIAPEAFDAYLQGKHHFQMETPEHLEKAIELYNEAILLEPSFARAYASKVVPTYLLGDKYGRMPSEAAFYLARDFANKALSLNNELPEAYIAQGIIRHLIDNDFESAQRSLERAINLNPQDSEAYREYGLLLLRMGLLEEGIQQLYRSQALNPTSLQIHRDIARAFYYNREYDKSIELLNEILALQPGFVRAYSILQYAYLFTGDYEQAEAAFMELQKHDKSEILIHSMGFLAELRFASGEIGKAKTLLKEMLDVRRQKEPNQGAANLCIVYALLGSKEDTLYWFNKAQDEQDLPPSYKVDPRWDSVRNLLEIDEEKTLDATYELTEAIP